MDTTLLTQERIEAIQAVLGALDPDTHDRFTHHRERLGAEDWDFVRRYVTEELRCVLEIGSMWKVFLDVAEDRRVAAATVCESFRQRQGVRTRNFGTTDDEDARFVEIAMSDQGAGLFEAAEALRQKAEAELFGDEGLPVTNPSPPGKREPITDAL